MDRVFVDMLDQVVSLCDSGPATVGDELLQPGYKHSDGEAKVQQHEVLTDGDAVLITQEVAADGDEEGFSGEGDEILDPLCHHFHVLHLGTWG